MLAVDSQNFAARRQYRGARASAHERLRQIRHRIDNVLAVIEYQQKMLSADGSRDGIGGNRFSTDLQVKNTGHRGRHEVGIGQRGQFDKPPAVLKVGEKAAGDLEGEGGFPNAARSRQGNNAPGGDKVS
jgi:hypothetical protein